MGTKAPGLLLGEGVAWPEHPYHISAYAVAHMLPTAFVVVTALDMHLNRALLYGTRGRIRLVIGLGPTLVGGSPSNSHYIHHKLLHSPISLYYKSN